MPRDANRLIVGRENNVVRVDFRPDPDPPAPKFPGASGLREMDDESTSATTTIFAVALGAAAPNFPIIDSGFNSKLDQVTI